MHARTRTHALVCCGGSVLLRRLPAFARTDGYYYSAEPAKGKHPGAHRPTAAYPASYYYSYYYYSSCACVRVRALRASVCVRACVRASVCVRVSAGVRVRASVPAGVRVRASVCV